jgi:pterin-4a-carbinolamine dehydratase
MSNILENIINNNKKINFDFTKSLNQTLNENLNYDASPVPIAAKESSWETIDDQNRTYLIKSYNFERYRHLIYFTSEILEHARQKNYHPELLIKENIVTMILCTQDLNEVTELDIEFSKFSDSLYSEINFINEF